MIMHEHMDRYFPSLTVLLGFFCFTFPIWDVSQDSR